MAFDAIRIIETLNRHAVRYLIIGGVAANVHGSPSGTLDVDVCYDRSPDNADRLAGALQELHASLRGAPPDLPFSLDGRTLQMGDTFTFITDAGDLDCIGTPAGTLGFDQLIRTAEEFDFDGISAHVASLEDLIAMKRAAGRPKDRIELEVLGALREEIEREQR